MKKISYLILIVCAIITLKSCSNELGSFGKVEENIIYKESLLSTKENLSKILIEENTNTFLNKGYSNKNGENLINLSLTKVETDSELLIKDFNELVDLINNGKLIMNEDDYSCSDIRTICLQYDEIIVNESFSELFLISKQILYDNHFTDQEIEEELAEYSSKGVIILAMFISSIEKNIKNDNFYDGVPKADVYSCLAVATGIAGVYDLIQNTRSLAAFGEVATRKQALKLVGKLARRALGWVGVALLINDFGNCMEYW